MTLTTTIDPRTIGDQIVLDEQAEAFFAAVAAEPGGLTHVAVQGPGGYGKSVILHGVARMHRRAGITVLDAWQDNLDNVEDGCLLVVDDAHLLDDARLRRLWQLARARRARLAIGYRPWPRPAPLVDLTDLLKRDGPPLMLNPFGERQIAAYLAKAGVRTKPGTVAFVQRQTGGVPRFVDRLARVLHRQDNTATLEVPQSVISQFGPDLEDLDPDIRRLLLAAATNLDLPGDALGALLGQDVDTADDSLTAARATGLLGQDGRLCPVVQRAVVALSPPAHRTELWQRLADLQRRRNAPVLPLVRALLDAGLSTGCPAETFEAAAVEALPDDPALAARLFHAAGRPATARQALASALAGDLDAALRLADGLVSTEGSPERADGAVVAATVLAHRGHLGHAAELFRWSGSTSALAFAAIGNAASGQPAELERLLQDPRGSGPPTIVASVALLMARGVHETLAGSPTAALAALVQGSALLEPAGRTALLPDSPAALAALVALQSGELDIGDRALERAVASRMGATLMARRHRLLQAWILMVRGSTDAAAQRLAAVTAGTLPEARDLIFATALELGIARRNSDLPALQQAWGRACDAVVRHPVDLFTLLPLGEIAVAAARLGELTRLRTYLAQADSLLDRLGRPALWAGSFHWNRLHAAIIAEQPSAVDQHVKALRQCAGHTRQGSALSAAADVWREVLRGIVDPVTVEAAARGLHDIGLSWDAARLAGQAAIRTADRKAMTSLLDCARMLQGGLNGRKGGAGSGAETGGFAGPDADKLSDREQEVAELVVAGLTYKQIGDRLFISAKTVEHHVARMRQRLNCANRSELLARLRAMAERAGSGEGSTRMPGPRPPTT